MYVVNQFSVVVGVVAGTLLPENSQRVGLIVSTPAANAVSISLVGEATAGAGITLRGGGDPLVLLPGMWG